MDELKDMLRRDLAPGADQLREGLIVIVTSGVEIPVAINDHEERYRLWSDFFSSEADAIRSLATEA